MIPILLLTKSPKRQFPIKNPMGIARKLILSLLIGRSESTPVNRLLANILTHSYHSTGYYNYLFDQCGINVRKDYGFDNFCNIPFLTKEVILKNQSGLISSIKSPGRYWNTSGGSTGQPVKILQDRNYLRSSRKTTYTQKQLLGYTIGSPMVKLWGDENEILQGSGGLKKKLLNVLKNTTFLNAFRMSPKNMIEYISVFQEKKPQLLVSYAQSLYELCCFAKFNSLKIQNIGSIITSAGTLYPFMRQTIEEVTGVKVYNRYGSREAGNIACECPEQDGLHVAEDGVFVEIIDDQGNPCKPGQPGEIVVTSLINYAMPLIRYRIGDIGVWAEKPCKCGFEGKLLKEVRGRTVDLFKSADGAVVDGEYFIHIMYFREWLTHFQFIQHELNLIELKLVTTSEPSPSELSEIDDKVKTVMGKNCRVNFNFVDQIDSGKSGKFRYTISAL